MRRVIRIIIEVVPAAVLVFGLINVLKPLLPFTVDLWLQSVIAVVGGIAYMLLLRWAAHPDRTVKRLRTDKPQFAQYYTNWYNREGTLHIFCNDVHWLQSAERATILETLKAKQSDVHLYLRNRSGDAATALENAGAHIHSVPVSNRVRVKFSLREDEDENELIIRTKKGEPIAKKNPKPKEQVNQYRDDYLIGLASEFFEALRDRQQDTDPYATQQ